MLSDREVVHRGGVGSDSSATNIPMSRYGHLDDSAADYSADGKVKPLSLTLQQLWRQDHIRMGITIIATALVCYLIFAASCARNGDDDAVLDAAASSNDPLLTQLRVKAENLKKENAQLKKALANSATGKLVSSVEKNGQHIQRRSGKKAFGSYLGAHDYQSFEIEANSTNRRFWVKTWNNEEGHMLYRRILVENGWVESFEPKDKEVVFQFYGPNLPGLKESFGIFTEGRNLINHIPGEWEVLNKEPWLYQIRNYSRAYRCDYTLYHPESYLMHDPEDCLNLFRLGDPNNGNQDVVTSETQSQRDKTFWFWKPPGAIGSFGRGIQVSSLKEIREKFGFGEKLRKELPASLTQEEADAAVLQLCNVAKAELAKQKAAFLIQRAVHPPFLIKDSKFDIRAYLLVTNTDPWTVYYRFGHVRRCLRKYDVSSKVKKVHVCNDYSDEMDEMGDKFPLDDHIWSLDKFSGFLQTELGWSEKRVEEVFITNMKRVFLATFRTFKDTMPTANGYWLLMGLDVAVDAKGNLFMLEVNTNPSMHYDSKTWGKEIVGTTYRMVGDMLELVMDAHHKARRGTIPEKDLIHRTPAGWHLIYSEQTDPPFELERGRCFKQKPFTTR